MGRKDGDRCFFGGVEGMKANKSWKGVVIPM